MLYITNNIFFDDMGEFEGLQDNPLLHTTSCYRPELKEYQNADHYLNTV